MRPLKLIVLIAAVTVVAGCGQDPVPTGAGTQTAGEAVAAGRSSGEAGAVVDDDEAVRLVFVAAADDDTGALPRRLTARVSAARVGVVALHDQLLARREPTPDLGAVLDALDALARIPGVVDSEALTAMVAAWRGWSSEQLATETELARWLSLANASFTGPTLPGAAGLASIVEKSDELGAPPPSSAAHAGIEFLRYAALAIGEDGTSSSAAQADTLDQARRAFEALRWPGGLALMAQPLAELQLRQDPTSLRGTVLWTIAADAYRASGDLLRSGLMYVDRARDVWRGQADPDAARRAALLAETGRRRIVESGVGGRELFEACFVHAYALQAGGRHDESVAAADAALAAAPDGPAGELADLDRSRAISFFRVGRYEDALAAAERGLERLGPDYAPERREALMILPVLHELAAQSLLQLGRYDEAVVQLDAVVAFHQREAGNPWASNEQRDAARISRARALAKSGDAAAARAAVRAVLESGAQGSQVLALAADVLLEAGYIDDADAIVSQAEQAIGPERALLFGELRGRIAVARGDLEGARAAFSGAIDLVTGGDPTRKSLSASRILESWARVEEAAGNRERAAELFQSAANHLVELGVDHELRRLLEEVKRLQ